MQKPSAAEQKEIKKLGKRIRQLREEAGLSLYDVEARGYLIFQHWQRLERGTNMSYTTLLKVCKTLDLQPSDLLAELQIKL